MQQGFSSGNECSHIGKYQANEQIKQPTNTVDNMKAKADSISNADRHFTLKRLSAANTKKVANNSIQNIINKIIKPKFSKPKGSMVKKNLQISNFHVNNNAYNDILNIKGR